jgi:hypothetical protein
MRRSQASTTSVNSTDGESNEPSGSLHISCPDGKSYLHGIMGCITWVTVDFSQDRKCIELLLSRSKIARRATRDRQLKWVGLNPLLFSVGHQR